MILEPRAHPLHTSGYKLDIYLTQHQVWPQTLLDLSTATSSGLTMPCTIAGSNA